MAHPLDNLALDLSINVLRLRQKMTLSQNQLSQLSGIPRSTIAHIESGKSNPSLTHLARLALAFQIPVEELVSKPHAECTVVEADALSKKARHKGGVHVIPLVPDALPGIEINRMEFDLGSTMKGVPHLDGTREYFSVLQGTIRIYVEGEQYILKKGDLLIFPGDRTHSYSHFGSTLAVGISAVLFQSLKGTALLYR